VVELRGDEALVVFSSAHRALRSAVELQERFAAETERAPVLPLQVGIGLDAGEALPVKGGYRGAALNLAAWLCQLAGPGEVLASDTVTNLARRVEGIDYRERGMVQLKGFADPVRVFQVASSADPPIGVVESGRSTGSGTGSQAPEQRLPIGGFLGALPSGPLVARAEELAQILSAVDEVMTGEGRLVMLAGEPGAGKTRLAQEVTLAVRNRGFTIAAGSCFEPRQSVPYYPFLDALASLYGVVPPTLRSSIPQRWPHLGRLLPEVGIMAPTESIDTQEDQERLFRAVTGFVSVVAESTPIAVLLDDLHWADQSTLDLLGHLARHTRDRRVLLVGAYRDVEVGRQHRLSGVVGPPQAEAASGRGRGPGAVIGRGAGQASSRAGLALPPGR
jgi:hypothetical protein